MDVIKRVNELTQKLRVVEGRDELSKEAQHNATLMFFSLLRCMLASRRVLEEHKLTDRSFNWLLGEVETRFNQVSTRASSKSLHDTFDCNVHLLQAIADGWGRPAWTTDLAFNDKEAFLICATTSRLIMGCTLLCYPPSPSASPDREWTIHSSHHLPSGVGASVPRRDDRHSGCSVHWGAHHPDDPQHLPLCRCVCQERHAGRAPPH